MNKIFENDDREISLLKIYSVLGDAGWMKGNPYLVLLKHYLDTFLPMTNLSKDNPQNQQPRFLASEESIGNLFLRLIIDFWIDTNSIVRNQTEQYLRNQLRHPHSNQLLTNTQNHCLDVHFLNPSPNALPTRHTIQCVIFVVSHLIVGVSPNNPLNYPISLLQQPIFDLLRSLFVR